MTSPAGEIGQLRDEELPAIRVIVPPDPQGRLFADDLDPGEVVFDRKLTAMLVWHERYRRRGRPGPHRGIAGNQFERVTRGRRQGCTTPTNGST
jgi:hypothetical protein